MTRDRRRKLGWTLVSIGVISTLPLAADVLAKLDDDADSIHLRGDPPDLG
jgi:hypothetical protein